MNYVMDEIGDILYGEIFGDKLKTSKFIFISDSTGIVNANGAELLLTDYQHISNKLGRFLFKLYE